MKKKRGRDSDVKMKKIRDSKEKKKTRRDSDVKKKKKGWKKDSDVKKMRIREDTKDPKDIIDSFNLNPFYITTLYIFFGILLNIYFKMLSCVYKNIFEFYNIIKIKYIF